MKRIGIIALTFVLTACLMTGCRRNDMQGDTGSTNGATEATGSTKPVTTQPSAMPMPGTEGSSSTAGSRPLDGSGDTDDAMPRSPIPGMGR